MSLIIKGTKALEAVKSTTIVTAYSTGAPVAPAAGHLAVYIDLTTGNEHRTLEIATKLQTLIDRAREINYEKPTAAAYYLRCPLDGDKGAIVETATSTDIVAGDVAIGISATVRAGESGSILFDECFKQIIEKMAEQDLEVDPILFAIRSLGATVLEGGTVAITSSMLRYSSPIADDDTIEYTATTGPANGQLEDSGDPGVAITVFTQEDINDGIIQYVHDGTDTLTGALVFTATDGTDSLTLQDFPITVTPVA